MITFNSQDVAENNQGQINLTAREGGLQGRDVVNYIQDPNISPNDRLMIVGGILALLGGEVLEQRREI